MSAISNNNGILDRQAAALEAMANGIENHSTDFQQIAKNALYAAGDNAVSATANAAGGAYQAGKALVDTAKSAEYFADAMVQGGKGSVIIAGAALVGAAEKTGDLATDGVYYSSAAAASVFAKLATKLYKVSGDNYVISLAKSGHGADATRLASTLVRKAIQDYQDSGTSVDKAAASAVSAAGGVVGSATNIALVAIRLGEAVANTAFAAAAAGASGIDEAAALGLRAAAVAVKLADQGVKEAGDAMVIAAKISAAIANKTADGDQGLVNIVSEQKAALAKAEAMLSKKAA